MLRRAMFSILVLTVTAVLAGIPAGGQVMAQAAPPATQSPAGKPPAGTPAKQIKRDEVFFSIGRRVNEASESQVSAVVAEVDGVIEVTGITYREDGKAEVTVKERAQSNASSTNKSIKLVFAPPATGDKWIWEQFEDNRRLYPVERLFPYAKAELTKRKQNTVGTWSAFLASIVRQGESASKVLDTAKAIIKTDTPQAAAVTAARTALNEAMKENKFDETIEAYNALAAQTEPILALGDTYTDLKANDAYLRLLEEFKNSANTTNAQRKNYVQAVETYNEALQRLPYGLVAYGLQFTRIEPKVTAE
ncbi:MAG TPA: LemA family protein [Blastocatellia bacterium]